ncbi:MAG TPA: rhodanese-like domain-containing protein, partial [Candidatus Polarisedimenticolia bacterium]
MSSPAPPAFRSIDPAAAEALVRDGSVRVVDVRSPEEYVNLGHIPGAALLPLDLIPSAAATLPRDGKPTLIYCEHGVRSAHAARFLAQAGFENLLSMVGGLSCWRGPRAFAAAEGFAPLGPSSWLLENADLLPRGGAALDLACGSGRHALLLAGAGCDVRAIDRDATTLASLRDTAGRLRLPVTVETLDLETGGVDLGAARYDLILVVHYLHRPLFPAILRALRKGGALIYETFTVDQAARGNPTNPDFLLQHGELARLVSPLSIVRERDGEFEGRCVAGVGARKSE